MNLTEATAEIKASQPENMALQNLTVPDSVGGEVHILLGIQYVAHFPKHIHSLESGLGIYELRLTPDRPITSRGTHKPNLPFLTSAGPWFLSVCCQKL